MNRPGVAGIEEPEVVDPEPQPAREFRPCAGVAIRHFGERHVRIARRNPLDHLTAAHRFFAIGREHDVVAVRGETFDRRLEEPQVRVVARDEQNLQCLTSMTQAC